MAAMRRSGAMPTAVSFNLLLSACERAGQPERVLEVFARMQRSAGAASSMAGGLSLLQTIHMLQPIVAFWLSPAN